MCKQHVSNTNSVLTGNNSNNDYAESNLAVNLAVFGYASNLRA